MKAYILANGEFPRKKQLLNELREAEFLIACDNSIRHLERHGILPDLIIGDLDSIHPRFLKKYASRIIKIPDQNSNDLSKAFYHGLKLGFRDFVIMGATGKREDHTLANIFLLLEYTKSAHVVMRSDFGEFAIYQTPCQIPSKKGEQISLFCLDTSAKITSKHLKYPLQSLALTALNQGCLNEALGEFFELESTSCASLLVYKAFIS